VRGAARVRRDAPTVGGYGGQAGAPQGRAQSRGAARLRRNAPTVGGYGGHAGAPQGRAQSRGAARLRRDAPNVGGYGGHAGAPILVGERVAGGGDDARDVGDVGPLAREAGERHVVGGDARDGRLQRQERAV